MNITFCTAWYNLKSKFNIQLYQNWMSNIINYVDNYNLVIYTNKESYYVLQPLLEKNKMNKKIRVIFKEWEEFYGYKWKTKWQNNHKNNNTLNNKSRWDTDWKLNMLWSEKINFVKDTMENHYFDSEYYGWCDIGYFRDSTTMNWPKLHTVNILKKHKIYYGQPGEQTTLEKLKKIILTKNKNNMPMQPIPEHQVSVAGGFFILHKDKLEWWHKKYYDRLKDYFTYNYLVKDDQIVIIDCIINNLKHFQLVKETNPYKDKWFVFHSYLR